MESSVCSVGGELVCLSCGEELVERRSGAAVESCGERWRAVESGGELWSCSCGELWRAVESCGELWRAVEGCGELWGAVELGSAAELCRVVEQSVG